ncbi:MAG: sulfotransferase [Longimonas sp.]|uniref:sulfotransferase family protein n=1 Tax=Longimonas sp. TaxID=2039626 RepID=UPI0039770CE0
MNASSAAPIFVVGANRSGTTLVRLMLNAHPHIAIPEELNYFKIGPYSRSWDEPTWDADGYAQFVDRVLDSYIPLLPGLDAEAVRPTLLEDPNPTYRTPYAGLLDAWAAAEGKPRWGEKTPGNLFYVDWLIEMFPDAQFIYVQRDPRAGVASMQRVSFFPDDVIFNALNRRKSWNVGYRLLTQVVPVAQRITIRYEDLVRTPQQVARTLCTFLGEPYAPDMLNFHTDAERYMKAEAASSFNEAATNPISDAHMERWKTALSPIEVGWIESICTEEMTHFGYTPVAPRRPLSARLVQYVKMAYWHMDMWRHRGYRPYVVHHKLGASLRETVQRLSPSAAPS